MDIFKKLKNQRFHSLNEQHILELFFKIDFDEHGAYVQVVDKQLKEVSYDYRQYLGYVRELLRNLEHIKDQSAFKIEWEKDSEHIYLAEHDYLLWQLKYCKNILDASKRPLVFQDKETTLLLKIQPDEEQKKLVSSIMIQQDGVGLENIQPLSESYFLAGQNIYPVKPIGNNFNYLKTFETSFYEQDLEKFLCLFFSYYQNIEVEYEDFTFVESQESIATQGALFFEKVDEENSLYLKVSQVLPNLEHTFLEDYEVNKLVIVNEVEKNIHIRDISYHSYPLLFKEVGKLIAGKNKKKNAFHQQDE